MALSGRAIVSALTVTRTLPALYPDAGIVTTSSVTEGRQGAA